MKTSHRLKNVVKTHILGKNIFRIYNSSVQFTPVQVRCTMLDAWGWCTGTTRRDGMGREEGGGLGMGNTCMPVVDSFQYIA